MIYSTKFYAVKISRLLWRLRNKEIIYSIVVSTVRQEIFRGQKFSGFLKIALVSKFRVFLEF